MKRTAKIIVIACIIFSILSISLISLAEEITPSDIKANYEGVQTAKITTLGGKIVAVVRTVGVVIAVVILLVLGIKYMMGSAEEKADYKKSMIPYIVGAICIFAATTVVGIVYDMADSLNAGQSDGQHG